MSVSVQVGLVLAVATALTSIISFLYKHRGAVEAPAVDFKRPVYSSIVLFKSGWYTLGIVIAIGSWGFHAGALALAPISLVQSVIAGGLVLLTVLADRMFGMTVTRREWIGVGLAAIGLAFLAATLDGGGDSAHSDYDALTIGIYVTVITVAGLLVSLIARNHGRAGILFGASAGLLWGASDVSIKGASASLDTGFALLYNPLMWVILILSLIGLLVSAKSLQLGDAVPVIAVTSIAANAVTITAGPIVFDDPLPDTTVGMILRFCAFALVIAAAALTPGPGLNETEAEAAKPPDVEPEPAGA